MKAADYAAPNVSAVTSWTGSNSEAGPFREPMGEVASCPES